MLGNPELQFSSIRATLSTGERPRRRFLSTKLLHSWRRALLSLVPLALTLSPRLVSGEGLVLWNKLGSASEILQSAYGPGLQFYSGGRPLELVANPAYGSGMFGNSLTIGPGSYVNFLPAHNVVFDQLPQYLNADRGTIEMWYKQISDPVHSQDGVCRLFDGDYGLGADMGLQSRPDGLIFHLAFGGAATTVQAGISSFNGEWIHVAGVWDRAGIAGSADKIRLYINGEVAAADTVASWGNVVGPQADIAGANDSNIAGQFYVDNLEVYDYALTDFTHRFQEIPVPEPTVGGLCSLGLLLVAVGRRGRGKWRP